MTSDQIIDDHIGRVRGLFLGILNDMAAIRHNYRDTIPRQVWLYLNNTYVTTIANFIAVEITDLVNALEDEQKRPYAIDAITGPAIIIDTEVLTNLPEAPEVSDDLKTSNPELIETVLHLTDQCHLLADELDQLTTHIRKEYQ